MSTESFMVAIDAHRWSVTRAVGDEVDLRHIELAPDTDLPARAAATASALAELGYEGQPLCLALPGYMVLTARINCENLPRRDRRTAMIYRLEEHLPIEAERLTADFIPPAGGRAMGLAVQTDQVRPILDALGDSGVEVAAICPIAMLALWQAGRDAKDTPPLALLASDAHVDLVRLEQGKPVVWHSLGPDSNSDSQKLLNCIRTELLVNPLATGADDEQSDAQTPNQPQTQKPRARLIGTLDEATADALRQDGNVDLAPTDDEPPLALAARAAGAALAGRGAGWVDLRRDDLAPTNAWQRIARPLKLATALALVLLAVLAATFTWRANQYDDLARSCEKQQADLFITLHSHRTVPVNVTSALRSEARRLAGVRGCTGSDLPPQLDALACLRRIITAMPKSVKLRIFDVRIGAAGILIEGHARNHTGAEVYAQSLRRLGLRVDPPRTESLARGGVAFTLAAKPADPGSQQPPAAAVAKAKAKNTGGMP